MALHTWPKFFYGFEVTEDNKYLSFSEGGPELIAEIQKGRYSPTDGLIAVANAMSDVGSQTYSCTLDRATRLVTVSATDPFELLVSSGSTSGSSIYPDIGFSGSDRTGSEIYTGDLITMQQYVPQFKLQDFIHPDHYKKAIDPTVKKAADGTVEVVRFGVEQFVQMNLKYITDKAMDWDVIRSNPTGLAEAVAFMDWLVQKANVEFMPDMADPDTYWVLLLEKTAESKDGTDYKLRELYDKNLPDVYETGQLTFRVVAI